VLTPLQQRLLDIVSRLSEADGFALAGGAALILRGTVDRNTNALDFFIGHADVEADTIAAMVAAVERALDEAGSGWRREVVTDTFARLTVETGHEKRSDEAPAATAAGRHGAQSQNPAGCETSLT
jgi:hypothetical protein